MNADELTMPIAESQPDDERSGRTGESEESAAPTREHHALIAWVVGLFVAALIASLLQIALQTPTRGYFLLVLCFLVTGVAAIFDVATRSIPNRLTYPAIVIGLLVNGGVPALDAAFGWDVAVIWTGATGLRDAMLGFSVCAAIGLVSFVARGLGGGDAKLVFAVGAILGLSGAVPVLFNCLLIAAVIGLVNLAIGGSLVARLQVMSGRLLAALITRKGLREVYPFRGTEAPFALSLFLGLVLAQFVELHRVLLSMLP